MHDIKTILSFLRSLRRHNDRVWFNDNKDRYLTVKEETEALTARLIAGVARFDPEASMLSPRDCLYRIYRDTRFSADKTPYKTHIGIYINPPGGKKSPTCGYYLHLEPDNCLVAGGCWCPGPQLVKAIRQDIFDNVEEYLEIMASEPFATYYKGVGENLLKTVPKGFPKDWRHIDLIKPRDFTAYTPLSEKDLCAPDFEERVLARMEAVKPLNDFFNFTITESGASCE